MKHIMNRTCWFKKKEAAQRKENDDGDPDEAGLSRAGAADALQRGCGGRQGYAGLGDER